MESTHCQQEVEQLKLLRELLSVLNVALGSLDNKTLPTPESRYLGWRAKSLETAADGYVLLREGGRVAASKLLVRPIIDALISAKAVVKDKAILFQQYYTEWEDAENLFSKDGTKDAKAKQELEDLKQQFRREYPSYPIKCARLTARRKAEAARLESLYVVAYQAYSEFAHSSGRSVAGHLDVATDPIDTSIVTTCVILALEQLEKHTAATVPNLSPFMKRQARYSVSSAPTARAAWRGSTIRRGWRWTRRGMSMWLTKSIPPSAS
jgi:hypothetical protein